MVGPIFFEFIQGNGDVGFVEGNVQALFKSIERANSAKGLQIYLALV